MQARLLLLLAITASIVCWGCSSNHVADSASNRASTSSITGFSEEELINAGKEIDVTKARELAKKAATAFIEGNSGTMLELMEATFKSQTSIEDFEKTFAAVRTMYGKPLSVEYKTTDYGKKYSGSWKPMHKFFFALETEKHPKGTHFLTLEIVKAGDELELSTFSVIFFPIGQDSFSSKVSIPHCPAPAKRGRPVQAISLPTS